MTALEKKPKKNNLKTFKITIKCYNIGEQIKKKTFLVPEILDLILGIFDVLKKKITSISFSSF